MATFDQLPADQRAIIELVLKRGRTYDALSDMLDMPTSRVRELARDALTELAPHTAERVDPDWRDQVADYILGQQSGPESVATQGHLRRSEGARAWFLSLMDSLDQLYANGTRPELPDKEGERPRARERKGRVRERPAAASKDKGKEEAKSKAKDDESDDDDDGGAVSGKSVLSGGRSRGPLSPAARAAVKRRRIIGGVAGLVLLALLVLVLTGTLFGGDDDGGGDDTQANQTTTAQGQGQNAQTQLIGQVELEPTRLAGRDGAGFAAIAQTGNQNQVAVRAKLPRTGEDEAYEVWLYNSREDAVSVGAQRTDAEGNYEGAGTIREGVDYTKYKYIDISLEKVDRNAEHSGRTVLRGEIANLQAPPAGQQGGAGQGGQAPGQTP
jgi:hypothetical protein